MLSVALLLPFALAACGGDQSATAVIDSPPPRQVKIATAVEAKVARTVSATGTLAAEDQVVLGTKVVGRLGEISVDLGSRVRKGEVIARIVAGIGAVLLLVTYTRVMHELPRRTLKSVLRQRRTG